jgi:hypothetical protein
MNSATMLAIKTLEQFDRDYAGIAPTAHIRRRI